MKYIRLLLYILPGFLIPGTGCGLPPLQLFVELTPAGGALQPPPGSYSGPVVIDRPLTLDGAGTVTVDGGGSGTVLSVKAEGTVVRGLHITNSGDNHDSVDAGLLLETNRKEGYTGVQCDRKSACDGNAIPHPGGKRITISAPPSSLRPIVTWPS